MTREIIRDGIRYHRKSDGWMRITPNGTTRFLGLFETLILLLGGKP